MGWHNGSIAFFRRLHASGSKLQLHLNLLDNVDVRSPPLPPSAGEVRTGLATLTKMIHFCCHVQCLFVREIFPREISDGTTASRHRRKIASRTWSGRCRPTGFRVTTRHKETFSQADLSLLIGQLPLKRGGTAAIRHRQHGGSVDPPFLGGILTLLSERRWAWLAGKVFGRSRC